MLGCSVQVGRVASGTGAAAIRNLSLVVNKTRQQANRPSEHPASWRLPISSQIPLSLSLLSECARRPVTHWSLILTSRVDLRAAFSFSAVFHQPFSFCQLAGRSSRPRPQSLLCNRPTPSYWLLDCVVLAALHFFSPISLSRYLAAIPLNLSRSRQLLWGCGRGYSLLWCRAW